MQLGSVKLDIESYRDDPASRRWELPAWGHPISQGVFPLFATGGGYLFPVGTAFVIGRNVPYLMTAEHNIREVFEHEPRLAHLRTAPHLPASIDIKKAGLTVLHHRRTSDGKIEFRLWPLETVDGAPPTDIVFATPRLRQRIPVLSFPISFDVPAIEERVWSIGYAGFPSDFAIPLDAVKNGTFNWEKDYAHRLMVVEGRVKRIFTQSFMAGYLKSPCFMFDEEIEHAQSGGPVLSPAGYVRGINSAGATSFFADHPASLASLIYPVAFANIRATLRLGIAAFHVRSNLLKLVARGPIATDGSEANLGIFEDEETGDSVAAPKFDPSAAAFTHDDFCGYQEGKPASTTSNPKFRIRKF